MRFTPLVAVRVLLFMFAAVRASGQTTYTEVIVSVEGLASIGDSSAGTGGGGALPPKLVYLLNASNVGGHHVPHVGVVMAHQDHSPRILDGRSLKTEGHFKWLRVQDAEQLIVKYGSMTPLKYIETEPATLCPPIGAQSSLYFLPRLSRVGKKNDGTKIEFNDLDPMYLKPKKADKKIAAFMEVSFGNLEAEVKSPVVWAFKQSPGSFGATHQQLTAHSAVWTFTITGSALILQSSKDGGAAVDILELKADGDGKIRFRIANAPNKPKNIGVQHLAGTKIASTQPPSDPHFSLYYEYLKKKVKDDGTKKLVRYIPVVSGVCVAETFSTDPCEIRRFVNIPDPGNCRSPTAPPAPEVGDLNCGPDNMP
jgi:hypothetical protein